MNNINEKESSSSNYNQETTNTTGGVIRGVLKNLIQRAASSSIGSLPAPKIIAKSSSQLADLIELRDQIKSSFSSNINDNTKIEIEKRHQKWLKYSKIILYAMPGFIKSSITGSTLFTIYEKYTSNDNMLLPNSIVYNTCLVGMVGGFIHGNISILWDTIAHKISTYNHHKLPVIKPTLFYLPMNLPFSVSGTLFSHTIVHTILFSSYELIKYQISDKISVYIPSYIDTEYTPTTSSSSPPHRNHTDTNNTDTNSSDTTSHIPSEQYILHHTINFSTIFISGGLSGLLTDLISLYFQPLEEGGLNKKSLRITINQSIPKFKVLWPAVFPSAIGFVAYGM